MSRRTRRQVILIIFLLFIGLTRLLFEFDPLQNTMQTLSRPISEKIHEFSLRQANDNQISNAMHSHAEQEYIKLRNQIVLTSEKYQTVSADVIRKDIGGFRKSIWLNKGMDDQIHVNQAVLSGGFLIGRVISVGKSISEVSIITDPNFRASATSNGANGLVSNKDGTLVLDLVPSTLNEGELIVSDGLDNIFDSGLPIGLVGQELSESSSIFMTYHLILSQNPADVDFVQVVRTSR